MKSLLKRHRVFVAAPVVLVACFCGHVNQSDAIALIDSHVRNVKPVQFSAGSSIGSGAVKLPVEEGDFFEAPFRLKVGDQLLNNDARQMYPSPAMLDIDQDGQGHGTASSMLGVLYHSGLGGSDCSSVCAQTTWCGASQLLGDER